MAVFSKLFHSVVKNCKRPAERSRQTSSPKESCCLNGLRIKAKLLLPVLALPDTGPAVNIFNATNWEKRKGKPLVSLTLSSEGLILSNNHDWALTSSGEAVLKVTYESIVSVKVHQRKTEVALISKRDDGLFWCICLKLKAIKGKTRSSRNRKITGEDLQQLIATVQGLDTHSLSPVEGLSKESSLVSVSDSLFYIDFGSARQPHPQETADDSALILDDNVTSIVPRSVSCPILIIPEHSNNGSQQTSQSSEVSATQVEDEVIDYGDLLAQHSECCINPCGLDCPMYPVETSYQSATEQDRPVHCSSNTQYSSPCPQYAYYWNSATGQYYVLPATQYPPALSQGQYVTPQLAPNTSGHMYNYGQLQTGAHSNASNYCAAYYTQWYQQQYQAHSCYAAPSSGYQAPSCYVPSFSYQAAPSPQPPVSDRKTSKLLKMIEKAASEENTCVPTNFDDTDHHQVKKTFQPTVLHSDSQSDHSPAFIFVSGQYQPSPHLHQETPPCSLDVNKMVDDLLMDM